MKNFNSKKLASLTFILLISTFAFGQSVLIQPGNSSKQFVSKSISSTYGYFSTTDSQGADLFFKSSETGDGSTGTTLGTISTFPDKFDIRSGIGTALSLGANTGEQFRISSNGLVGIGTTSPNYNLQIHNPTGGASSTLQLTNATRGLASTDGLNISINNFGNASIINQEGGSVVIASGGDGIVINDGKVGIGNPFVSSSTGKLEIFQNTGNIATTPHINLRTLNNASNGMIRMESSTANRYFGQYFNVGSGTAANNYVSFDYNGTTPILDLKGNGNVEVAGFTKLGGAAAPSIKMKKLTGTTNAAQGAFVSIPMGLVDPTKIISINVLVKYNGFSADAWVGNAYASSSGYQFDYQYDGANIIISNVAGNSAQILSKAIKIVITYEE